MTITKDMHKKLTTKSSKVGRNTYGDKINTYGESYSGPEQHQDERDTFFMDRDMHILHEDLKKIIKLLERKK